jgi:hypothetical protein
MNIFYDIEPELALVAKEHLISNQKSITNIYPEDEGAVLGKLSDDLRESTSMPMQTSTLRRD